MNPLLFYIPLSLLIVGVAFLLLRNAPAVLGSRFVCAARRALRRQSWFYLLLAGLPAYWGLTYALTAWQAAQAGSGDAVQAATMTGARLVDFIQVVSKMAVAGGAFCLANLLAWGALNLVMPVLADWAKGLYKEAAADLPAVAGFKGTFLAVSGVFRLLFYFVGFGLELYVATECLRAAFTMQ